MTMKVICKHNLVLVLPVEQFEHTTLVSQVSELLKHLEQFPDCKFRRFCDKYEMER